MVPQPEKQRRPELDDPRLEFARRVTEQCRSLAREKNLLDGPSPAIDIAFCFDEESHT